MAKKKKESAVSEVTKLSKEVAKVQQANQALLTNLANEQAALEATFRQQGTEPPKEQRKAGKLARLMATAENKMTKTHRVTVDLGGGMTAQASTELINLGVRALGRWTPDSWVGQNSDILQGAPHFIIGLGIYIAEMASRKSMVLPSTTREVISEASKLFSQLGFSNLVRALRVRYADGKQTSIDMAALRQERDDLERRLRDLQAKGK